MNELFCMSIVKMGLNLDSNRKWVLILTLTTDHSVFDRVSCWSVGRIRDTSFGLCRGRLHSVSR